MLGMSVVAYENKSDCRNSSISSHHRRIQGLSFSLSNFNRSYLQDIKNNTAERKSHALYCLCLTKVEDNQMTLNRLKNSAIFAIDLAEGIGAFNMMPLYRGKGIPTGISCSEIGISQVKDAANSIMVRNRHAILCQMGCYDINIVKCDLYTYM